MKPIALLILLGLLIPGCPRAATGLELTLSWPHPETTVPGRWMGSLSYFRTGVSAWPGFSEWGVTGMPPISRTQADSNLSGQVDSFAGAYGGHVFPLWSGLIRPGFQLGTVWEEVWKDGEEKAGSLSLYYAFRIQASCLTFILSNRGQGIGLNFSL